MEVHFIVSAYEKMVSRTGLRPGNVVIALNGKTIEANNLERAKAHKSIMETGSLERV